MTLAKAIINNNVEYDRWYAYGQHEADNGLNNSNRELISAYKKVYPNAKGYKYWQGITEITEPVYNFAFDVIFDGTTEAIEEFNSETDEYKKSDLLLKHNGMILIWT